MKVNILIISFANWCILGGKAQSYLPSYTALSQHSFAPLSESSFGFSGPTAYTLSGFSSPSKYFGTYKTTYKRPKIYTAVLSQKYSVPTVGYEVANLNHFQEEFTHHAPAQYEFQYKVHDPHYGSEFGHAETRHGDVAKGQYMVLLPDGRRQIVDYIADSHGYRPTIRYERSFDKIRYGRSSNESRASKLIAEDMDEMDDCGAVDFDNRPPILLKQYFISLAERNVTISSFPVFVQPFQLKQRISGSSLICN